MLFRSRNSDQKIRDALVGFAIDYPYPSFPYIITEVVLKAPENIMSMYSSYGASNHRSMTLIYDGLFDPDVLREEGIEINIRGGVNAMLWCCCVTIAVVDHLCKKNNVSQRDALMLRYAVGHLINRGWQGIGDWDSDNGMT